jgi:16S rRNA processing protein RimM
MSTSNSSTEPPAPGLLEVGHILRPHGIQGEIALKLLTDRSERVAPGSVLHTHQGPLEVEQARPDKQRWLVRFHGVGDRTQADRYRGVVLYAEPIDDPDELWVHDLIGSVVICEQGIERGTVASVQENPASDLLVLDSGALVPLTFLDGTPEGGTIRVTVPPGLFDL